MEIVKLSEKTMDDVLFSQLVVIEAACGLEPYTPEMLMECVSDYDTYACMDGKQVAGFITIHPGHLVYIVNLNVAKPYRRQGIAQRLLRECCSKYEGKYVMLDVAKHNTPARRLYEKLGFRVSPMPSGNGDTDVVMTVSMERLRKGES